MAHTLGFTKTQKHKNAKERLSERIPKFIWGRPSVSSFDDGTSSKLRVSERNETLFQLPNESRFAFANLQKSLHPFKHKAWKKLRHGVAVNFLSLRKYIEQSLTNKCFPIKFYKISKKLTAIGLSHKLWFNKSIMSSWTRFRISPRAFLVLLRGQILKRVQDDVGGMFAASPMANG